MLYYTKQACLLLSNHIFQPHTSINTAIITGITPVPDAFPVPSTGMGSADPGAAPAGAGTAGTEGTAGRAGQGGSPRGLGRAERGPQRAPRRARGPGRCRPRTCCPPVPHGSGAAGGCGPRCPLRPGDVEAKPAGVPGGWARSLPSSAGAGGSGAQWPAAVSHGRAPPAVLNPPPGGRRRTRGLRCRRGRERLLPPPPPHPHGALGRGEAGAA